MLIGMNSETRRLNISDTRFSRLARQVQGVFFEKGRSQARVSGTVHLTSHHLLFVPGENESGQENWVRLLFIQ